LKHLLFIICYWLFACTAWAQSPKKSLHATNTNEKIIIDGKLEEREWQQAEKATEFIQLANHPGEPSIRNTEVSILYDESAVYIGAMLYDQPDSMLKQLSARDDYSNNTDYFGVLFDTYHDKQNAAEFIVTAAGVQTDARLKADDEDFSWNTTWLSKVTVTKDGWVVEMKIPYVSLRFPANTVQQWGVNFFRSIRRTREKSYWNKVEPQAVGLVNQSGILEGIHDIKEPLRLSLIPYASSYINNYNAHTDYSVNGGLDVKYGFNESFTLDMTLIPDFGQTRFDNTVLNLSPFEVKYDERRYFFTEGIDLFNKNDLFYSRRIGGSPVNMSKATDNLKTNEVITDNPVTSKLYNATKISGRNSNNLGIGFFNAVTAPTYATIKDTMTGKEHTTLTNPLTNYNVLVLDQALKNNSYISFINTNVNRQKESYNANVSALLFRFADKPNKYAVEGAVDMSQLYFNPHTDVGYRYNLSLAKVSGNYTCNLRSRTISDGFNPNDAGYLDRNNYSYYIFDQNYNIYKPFGNVFRMYNSFSVDYFRIYNPGVFQKLVFDGSNTVILKNYFAYGISWEVLPIKSNDYYEPRTAGRFYKYPETYFISGFISTDYRKKFAYDINLGARLYNEKGRYYYSWSVSPRYRFNDKLSMIYSLTYENSLNNVGFVNNVHDTIYLGIRDVQTITNSLRGSYIFTNKMSLKLDVRHYWSQAQYNDFKSLNADGTLSATAYNNNHNVNFNSFNVFLMYIWQFAPGSEVSIVYQNAIFSSGSAITTNYFDNVNNTFRLPQTNSLSLKVIYYLDYQSVFPKHKGK
jgi:Domain of unknown function (DUF5916)/Carbohydrate family 9 binding domain-like